MERIVRRIKGRKLGVILATGGCPGISKDLASGAYWLGSLLLAARGWSTIGGFTQVARLPDGRFAAPVDGRWAVTFSWDWDVNRAYELDLEYL
jgi:hypothetical protein